MSPLPTVLLVANGPGELAAFVRPVLAALAERGLACDAILALVPCPHASGSELEVAQAWPEGLPVWSPKATTHYLWGGAWPGPGPAPKRGVVLFLGGDQAFGAGLAWRTGWPLLTYAEGPLRWPRWTSAFLAAFPEQAAAARAKGGKHPPVLWAGHLMVDAVRPSPEPLAARDRLGLAFDRPVLALLPGSKPAKVRHGTGLFLAAAARAAAQLPGLQIILPRAETVSTGQLLAAASDPWPGAYPPGEAPSPEGMPKAWSLRLPGGARVKVVEPEDRLLALAVADLALVLPGTATAELGALGTPMLCTLPLHRPEVIPLDGTLGRVADLPLLGPWIRRRLAAKVAAKPPLLAWPNRRAGHQIAPELVGAYGIEVLAEELVATLADGEGLRAQRLALRQAMGPPGAAARIAEAVARALAAGPARPLLAPEPAEPPLA